jgi:hypothetical protein
VARTYFLPDKDELRRRIGLALIVAPFAVLSVATVLAAVFTWTRPNPPGYAYLEPLPAFPAHPVCPGEILSYQARIVVTQVPTHVEIVESLWSVDQQRTVLFDLEPAWAAYARTGEFTRTFEFPLPTDLAPGAYELNHAAGAYLTPPSGFAVPFRVRADCRR